MAKPAHRDTIYRSSWEEQYSNHLRALEKQNQIQSFSYESIRLRISGQGFYTPDFLVIQDDEVQFHEVKGMRREAGMVRLRTAAHQHRWARFFLVTKVKRPSDNSDKWQIEEIV